MSNVGKWDKYHKNAPATPYANTITYAMGMEFLDGHCDVIEDWGCGMGWAETLVKKSKYRGVDGSEGLAVDTVADLETYRSEVDGIFMRHVLEHNHKWEPVLDNALASFKKRMSLITFTPYMPKTTVIAENAGYGNVPDIAFSKEDLVSKFRQWIVREETMSTASGYGTETIYFLEKPEAPAQL